MMGTLYWHGVGVLIVVSVLVERHGCIDVLVLRLAVLHWPHWCFSDSVSLNYRSPLSGIRDGT